MSGVKPLRFDLSAVWVRFPEIASAIGENGQSCRNQALVNAADGRYHRDTVRRWAKDGLSWGTADELAVSLGVEPDEIWPDYHEQIDAYRAEMLQRKYASNRRYKQRRGQAA